MSNNNNKQTLRWWISTRNLIYSATSIIPFFHSFRSFIGPFYLEQGPAMQGEILFQTPPFVYSTVFFGAIFYGFNMISFDRSIQKKGSTTSQKKVFDTLELKNLLLGLSELGYFQTTPYLSAHPHPTPKHILFSK